MAENHTIDIGLLRLKDAFELAPLLAAYARQRPFAAAERAAWRDVLCLAATRFWVSREAALRAPTAELTGRNPKDPEEFRARLLACERAAVELPGAE